MTAAQKSSEAYTILHKEIQYDIKTKYIIQQLLSQIYIYIYIYRTDSSEHTAGICESKIG